MFATLSCGSFPQVQRKGKGKVPPVDFESGHMRQSTARKQTHTYQHYFILIHMSPLTLLHLDIKNHLLYFMDNKIALIVTHAIILCVTKKDRV